MLTSTIICEYECVLVYYVGGVIAEIALNWHCSPGLLGSGTVDPGAIRAALLPGLLGSSTVDPVL